MPFAFQCCDRLGPSPPRDPSAPGAAAATTPVCRSSSRRRHTSAARAAEPRTRGRAGRRRERALPRALIGWAASPCADRARLAAPTQAGGESNLTSVQPLVAAFLRLLVGELLIPGLVDGVGSHRRVNPIVAGRQPIAAMGDLRAAAVRAWLEGGAVPDEAGTGTRTE